jgi:hypothetical protein
MFGLNSGVSWVSWAEWEGHSWKKLPDVTWGKICQKSTRQPIDPIENLSKSYNSAATLRAKTGLKLAVGKERQVFSFFPVSLV